MTNLIVDFNNLVMRSLFITGGYGSKGYTFGNQNEIDQLIRKLSTDISYLIRQVNPSRVIFAVDSKSWRKDIEIEENEGYKGNRSKNTFINWDNIYNTMSEFSEILKSNGFIVTKIDNAEADDIMALWRNEILFNENQHVILASSDEDVRQLSGFFPYEPNKIAFSVIFNPFTSGKNKKKCLFVPNHFKPWLNDINEGDIFNRAIDVDKDSFKRLLDTERIDLEEIDGNNIALKKLICGDDGDNVPSIYTWVAQTNKGEEKQKRITNSIFKQIIENLKVSDHYDLMEKSDKLKVQLEKISKEKITFDIENRIKRQSKLVVLDTGLFPKEIVNKFNELYEEELKKPLINSQNFYVDTLLEGTKYVSLNRRKSLGSESSIFKEVDRITKQLF